MKKIITGISLFVFLMGLNSHIAAQSIHQTSSSIALGGGGTAYVDGYHANFVNPANLSLQNNKPDFTVGVLGGISVNGGGSLLNVGVYNDYFTQGLTISGSVANEMMNEWFGSNPASMRNIGMQTDIIPLGLSVQKEDWAMSLALRTRSLLDFQMSKGMAELGIYGLDSEIFSDGKPVNFNLESLIFNEISLGYSAEVLQLSGIPGLIENIRLSVGAAPKLILGTQSSRFNFDSIFTLEGPGENEVDLIRHDFAYSLETTGSLTDQLHSFYTERQNSGSVPDINNYVEPQPSDLFQPSATGMGLDLGATAEMELNLPVLGSFFRGPEILRVGASLTDLGKVSFNDDVGRFVANDVVEWRGFDIDEERIDEEFDGDRGKYFEHVLVDSIATEIYGSFAPDEADAISRSLPSMMNLGGQLVMNNLSVSLDFGKGFVESGTNSRRVSASAGAEYKLAGIIPIRVGVRTGGYSSTSYSAGTGLELRNFEFSLGATTVRNSSAYGTSAGAAFSGLVFRF